MKTNQVLCYIFCVLKMSKTGDRIDDRKRGREQLVGNQSPGKLEAWSDSARIAAVCAHIKSANRA